VTAFQKYLCIDPSFFTKKKRIEKLPDVLTNLSTTETTIVLPSFLKSFIDSENNLDEKISNNDEITDIENFKILKKIDSELKEEGEFFQIAKKARNLFKKFRVTTADKIISRLDTDGFYSKHIDEISKFGNSIQSTVIEFMTISSNLQGTIVAYGKKFISIVRKIRIPVLEGYSKVKHRLIDSKKVPPMLRIISFVIDVTAWNAFVGTFGIEMGMGEVGGDLLVNGLLLVGDGNVAN
tara:strand:+ start:944 stop:1654 length:711 start_codon:yes stop_codon:yes gene_type:complete